MKSSKGVKKMSCRIKSMSHNKRKFELALIIVIMTIGWIGGLMNTLFFVFYGIVIRNFVVLMFKKEEVIEISNNQLIYIKHKLDNEVIELSNIVSIAMRHEGNWAMFKNVIVIDLVDTRMELIVSNFDMNELKLVIQEVCKQFQIPNDIS